MSKKTVNYTKRAKAEGLGVEPITDLLQTTFKIVEVTINKGLEYETAIITVEGGEKFRTTSDVLLEQLKGIEEWLVDPQCDGVEVSLKQVGRYYTF